MRRHHHHHRVFPVGLSFVCGPLHTSGFSFGLSPRRPTSLSLSLPLFVQGVGGGAVSPVWICLSFRVEAPSPTGALLPHLHPLTMLMRAVPDSSRLRPYGLHIHARYPVFNGNDCFKAHADVLRLQQRRIQKGSIQSNEEEASRTLR